MISCERDGAQSEVCPIMPLCSERGIGNRNSRDWLSIWAACRSERNPNIAQREINEALWYACRFWMEHVVDIEDVTAMSDTFPDMLRRFLSTHLVSWLKLLVSVGQF
jgi:hypothetical protein